MKCIWEGILTAKSGQPETIYPPLDCSLIEVTALQGNSGVVWLGGQPDRKAPLPRDPADQGSFDQSPLAPGPGQTKGGTPLNPGEPITWQATNTGELYIDVENDNEGISFSVFR